MAAQCQQFGERYSEPLLRITTEVLFDKSGSETVEAGGHRRVGGEEVPRSRDGQCDIEGLRGLQHQAAGTLQHGQGCVPFVEVAHFGLDPERDEQPPATDPEEDLLGKAQLRPPAVQLAGDPATSGDIGAVVTVEQVELHSTNLDLPGP